MALVLTEDQNLLKQSAAGFFAEKSPITAFRTLRDNRDERGYDTNLWQEMTEMGFTALLLPESEGGTGFGYMGAGIVVEAMARTLVASPLVSSCFIALDILRTAGVDVASLATGANIASLAIDEGAHHNPAHCTTTATKSGDSWQLNGTKHYVPDGHIADQLIVSAQSENGLSLYLINTNDAQIDRTIMADHRNWATVTLDNTAATLLGEEGQGMALLAPALDKANILLSAELLGLSQAAFDMTMGYLKERKQFGRIIGTFQGLQHRAAHLFSELEVTRSALLKALQAIDADASPEKLAVLASIAKARAAKTAELATNEAIQMHGGIGMTDEYDVGFFIKRARAVQNLYGGYNHHVDRYASLNKF